MAFNTNITPGRPPLLWDNVNDALIKINENFDIIVATVGGGSGLTPVNFETLDTNVSPSTSNEYTLGSVSNRWKTVFLQSYSDIPGEFENGIYIGPAHIKGIGATIDLPAGSTIDGNLIIDNDKTFWKYIQVDNGNSVEASSFGDTLNLLSGDGIEISVTDSNSDSITITNTGVLSVAGSTYISVLEPTPGDFVFTNTGVTNITNSTTLPLIAQGRPSGAGIIVNQGTGGVSITNTGVLDIQAGTAAITISKDSVTGVVTITNAAPAGNSFRFVEVDSDIARQLEANSVNGILRFRSGVGITLDKTVATDTVIINVNPVFDIKGSVFGDDSTKIVDAVENKVYGGIYATTLRSTDPTVALGVNAGAISQGASTIAIGSSAGQTNQGTSGIAIGALSGQTNQGIQSVAVGPSSGNSGQGIQSVAVGNLAGSLNQGQRAVAIGSLAGSTGQGDYAVALGNFAGGTNQPANSIVINASGVALNGSGAGLFIDPVRSGVGTGNILQYNTTTKEIIYTSSLDGDLTGSVFADNSTLLVDGLAGKIVGPVETTTVIASGGITGNLTGNVTGNTNGFHDGDVSGSVFADNSTLLVDAVSGTIPYANVTGFNMDLVSYRKTVDQATGGPATVTFPATPTISNGSSFGSMAATGIFTFSKAGIYQVTVGLFVSSDPDSYGGVNGTAGVRHLQVSGTLTKTTASGYISVNAGDTFQYHVLNNVTVFGLTANTATRITFVKVA